MTVTQETLEALDKIVRDGSILVARDVVADLYNAFEKFMMFAGPVLYNASKKAGRLMAQRLAEKGLVNKDNALDTLLFTIVRSGYAEDARVIGEERRRGKRVILVELKGSLLGSKLKGKKKPVDAPIGGFIAGWLEAIWGKHVDAKEVKCIAKGDETCRFEIIVKE